MNFLQKQLDILSSFDYNSFFTFDNIIKLVIAYFFVIWVSIIIWVTKDIINRTNNILYQVFSILTVLILTPLGLVVYFLIRPSKTLFEKYYIDSEVENIKVNEDIEQKLEEEFFECAKCGFEVESDFNFCPNCREKLKIECKKCFIELKTAWTICPYCGTDQDDKVGKILDIDKKDNSQKNKEKLESTFDNSQKK